jgi:hypothetical protein
MFVPLKYSSARFKTSLYHVTPQVRASQSGFKILVCYYALKKIFDPNKEEIR